MKGKPSRCSICGTPGEVMGIPTFNVVCSDARACRDTAIENERRKVKELEKRIKELKAVASEKGGE